MPNDTLGIGIIGCGVFSRFAAQNFLKVPGVTIAGVADAVPEAAGSMASAFSVPVFSVKDLVRQSSVDIVYIATPPAYHHPQSMLALENGKHVITEKPMAMSACEADEMIDMAVKKDRLVVTNLMQRYNPLFEKISALVDSGILGSPLHGFFENYASDENLSKTHWFWERSISGGIFIEHGVHFFDLFAGWLGEGKVLSAQRILRPGSPIEEQVHCTALYNKNIVVDFYHGFHQPLRMDRQELRLLFERGDVTLYEWVPTRVRLDAIIDESQFQALENLFPNAKIETLEVYEGERREAHARHKLVEVDRRILLRYGEEVAKMDRYGEMVRAMLTDQIAWIRDKMHLRRITAQNGRDSLVMAAQATAMASEATAPGKSKPII